MRARSMRIGIANIDHGRRGGIERISAEAALAAARAGHTVEYYCFRHGQADHEDIRFHRLSDWARPNSLRIARFARIGGRAIGKSDVDVTHSYGGVIGCDVITAQSCHLAGMEVGRANREAIREQLNLGIADRVRLHLERENFGGRQYRRIIACSQRVKRELGQYYGVPEGDVTVIPNGVDLGSFQPEKCRALRKETRERLGILENEFLLLFAGNEFARKGLQTVLEALKGIAGSGIRLLVVGGGRARPYRQLATDLRISGQVTFAGRVDDMVPYYGAADLFVFPTRYEPFGMVITEAMASGLPVLVSVAAGAAEDLIRDGQDGLLIQDPRDSAEVASKIRMVIENWQLRTTLASFGRLRVLQLGWDQYGDQLLDVYEEVLARKQSGPAGEDTRAPT